MISGLGHAIDYRVQEPAESQGVDMAPRSLSGGAFRTFQERIPGRAIQNVPLHRSTQRAGSTVCWSGWRDYTSEGARHTSKAVLLIWIPSYGWNTKSSMVLIRVHQYNIKLLVLE